MTRFKDGNDLEWALHLTVGMVEKLEEDADFDLDAILDRPEAIGELLTKSPRKLGAALWVLCEDEAVSRGVEPRAFGFLLDRGTIDRATDALIAELVLFYPRSSAGKAIAGRLPELLAKMDRDIERGVADRMRAELSATATASPGSAGSTLPG